MLMIRKFVIRTGSIVFLPALLPALLALGIALPAHAEETLKVHSVITSGDELRGAGEWTVEAVVSPARPGEVRDCWGLYAAGIDLPISRLYTDRCVATAQGDGTYRVTMKIDFPERARPGLYMFMTVSLRMVGEQTAEYAELAREGEPGPSLRVRPSGEPETLIFSGARIVTESGSAQVHRGELFEMQVELKGDFELREGVLYIPVLKAADLDPETRGIVYSDVVTLRPNYKDNWWNVETVETKREDGTRVFTIRMAVPKSYDYAAAIEFESLGLVSREFQGVDVSFGDRMRLFVVP